jgi:YVTN family beta-propeller protein
MLIYIANHGGTTISVINPATNTNLRPSITVQMQLLAPL